ncbi:MAG: hypothetical protein Fur0024_3350 [Patescibacteria group bacterium]
MSLEKGQIANVFGYLRAKNSWIAEKVLVKPPFISFEAFISESNQKLSNASSNMTCIDFSKFSAGTSIEGQNKISDFLTIKTSTGKGKIVKEGIIPQAYIVPKRSRYYKTNGCLNSGFADIGNASEKQHSYEFIFSEGIEVNNFSLKLLDYGDWNPFGAKNSSVKMVGFNKNGEIVATEGFDFNSKTRTLTNGQVFNGGACEDAEGLPGNYKFNLEGEKIVRVTLSFKNDGKYKNSSSDPNIALKDLCFSKSQNIETEREVSDKNSSNEDINSENSNDNKIDSNLNNESENSSNNDNSNTNNTVSTVWDKSSLYFDESFMYNFNGSVKSRVCNGQNSQNMTGTTNYEVFWASSGNPKNGVSILKGEILPLKSGECQILEYSVLQNLNGEKGVYMFKAYQRTGHPGTGELWSSAQNV